MDIDKLRPEVRDALDVVADDARCVCSEAYTSRDMFKRWYNETRASRDRLERRNASLRGQITKLRKRLAGE